MRTPFAALILAIFIVNTLGPLPQALAEELRLPVAGVIVHLSPEYNPPLLKGIKVHPNNPFQFDFILDKGDRVSSNEQLKEESSKLIKYFLASITTPEKDLWVNLSPYEKDRIIPTSFGLTEMGRDLLAQDYILKQITASLMYPEDEVGKKFWKRIYDEAAKKYGTTHIPVNTFNKVWIVPDKAVVYENAKVGTAYVVESKLKVMLESDYLARSKNNAVSTGPVTAPLYQSSELGKLAPAVDRELVAVPPVPISQNDDNEFSKNIIREIIIPELTREINEGKNFAKLRQVYQSLILANWYKKKIKDSILGEIYQDKNKVKGITTDNPQDKDMIYQRYIQSFKKGVYNYIKEEQDPITRQQLPRKYFSGGLLLTDQSAYHPLERLPEDYPSIANGADNAQVIVQMKLNISGELAAVPTDRAMKASEIGRLIEEYESKEVLLNRDDIRRLEEIVDLLKPYVGTNTRVRQLFIDIVTSKQNVTKRMILIAAVAAADNDILEAIEGIQQRFIKGVGEEYHMALLLALLKYGKRVNLETMLGIFQDKPDFMKDYLINNLDVNNKDIYPLILGLVNHDHEDRFVRRKAAELLGHYNTRSSRTVLLDVLKDEDGLVVENALKSLAVIGDEDTIAKLRDVMSGQEETETLWMFDDHGSLVAYKNRVDFSGYTSHGIHLLGMVQQPNHLIEPVRNTINAIEARLKIERFKRKIDLDTIQDKRLVAFLQWLKSKGLEEDIVVIGGGVRDVYAGKNVADIDISVPVLLSDAQRLAYAGTTSQLDEEIYEDIMSRLKRFAAALGVDVRDLLTSGAKEVYWKHGDIEMEIQYAGPIKLKNTSGEDVFLKRCLVDRDSRAIYSSSSGPTILQMALDAEGNLYGRVGALEDFDRGSMRIVGDIDSFDLGGVLRALRVKNEYGLALVEEDEELMRTTVAEFRSGKRVLNDTKIGPVLARQYTKVMKYSQDRDKALKDLNDFGIRGLLKSWGVIDEAMLQVEHEDTEVGMRGIVNFLYAPILKAFKQVTLSQTVTMWVDAIRNLRTIPVIRPAPGQNYVDKEKLKAKFADEEPQRKAALDKLTDHVRYVPQEEFETRLKRMTLRLNDYLKAYSSYGVMSEYRYDKSRTWVYTLAIPWLRKAPAVMSVYSDRHRMAEMAKQPAVVFFDDISVNGSLNGLDVLMKNNQDVHVYFVIPFMTQKVIDKLKQQYPGRVFFIVDTENNPLYEVIPQVKDILTPTEISLFSNDYSTEDWGEREVWPEASIVTFQHKIPDIITFPDILRWKINETSRRGIPYKVDSPYLAYMKQLAKQAYNPTRPVTQDLIAERLQFYWHQLRFFILGDDIYESVDQNKGTRRDAAMLTALNTYVQHYKDYSSQMTLLPNDDIEGGSADGTVHGKYLSDPKKGGDGTVWFFKSPPRGRWHRVLIEDLGYKLAQRLKSKAAVHSFGGRMGDKFGIFSQWEEKQGSLMSNLSSGKLKGLTREQLITIVREHPLDWLISNHDSHVRSFLKGKGNQLKVIDKGQGYKYFGSSDERLALDYNPNGIYNGQNNVSYFPVYNLVWKALRDGEFDAQLTFEEAKTHVEEVLTDIQSINDTDLMNELGLGAYAHLRFDILAPLNMGTKDQEKVLDKNKFLQLAIKRKNNIRSDFNAFLESLKPSAPPLNVRADEAQLGGIDLTSDNMFEVKDDGNGEITFKLDPAMRAQLENAPGFTPVIINILPMKDLKQFLGIVG